MSAKNVLGIIFSNAYDEVLPELTALRTMGSIPFAARYRLIDFPLSNMVNAGIPQVGVITKSNYRSLMDHIGNGKPWDLSRKREGMTLLPPFDTPAMGMTTGKADALYGSISYITKSAKDHVLLTDCNVVCNMDYEKLIKAHTSKDADITIAYAKGNPPSIENGTELILGDDGRVVGTKLIDCFSGSVNYSLKIMIIRRTLLERLLHEAHSAKIDDFETLVANNVKHLRVYGYEETGFVRVLGSLQNYYDISLELLKLENRKALFTPDRPVYTKVSDQVPSIYGIGANVKNSLVADGCKIYGEVENSILFRGVTVEKGAKIKNSIVMQNTFVGENSTLECVIIDKSAVVKPNKMLCGASNYPVYIGKGIVI
ncbi:MAG: glucose-1-phosphate adenylyltransferase subunit GlgD [Clostridia bacterium]|nr:glucose-1-phosphate adenylyltransferase subunit GlgD [Clostridia bacterium]MBQ7121238.1 glucose-1-phosphate adenylyltransferase subunit GlgD [Clostridia bacterium]